ncbi:MAG: hypothetical protein ACK4IX_10655 [Candidatus Sericytochromatia bacterium]
MEINNKGLDNLESVTRRATQDGYVSRIEALEIEKQALKDDNTVNSWEKDVLQNAYNSGAYFEPRAKITMERLVTYGDNRISDQMYDLRQQKQSQHWFNDEYIQRAVPVLVTSTDSIRERMNELGNLKRETGMFTSEYTQIAKQILVNSNDSIVERMSQLSDLKRSGNLWNDDYKELGKEILLNSYDNKTARLMALDSFKSSAGLWSNEYNDIKEAIMYN